MEFPFEALNDRIVIEPEEIEETIETSKGSGVKIVIPEVVKSKEQEAVRKGIVRKVGPGMTISSGEVIRPKIEEGATILYQPYAKSEFLWNNKKFHIIRWEDADLRWFGDNEVKS